MGLRTAAVAQLPWFGRGFVFFFGFADGDLFAYSGLGKIFLFWVSRLLLFFHHFCQHFLLQFLRAEVVKLIQSVVKFIILEGLEDRGYKHLKCRVDIAGVQGATLNKHHTYRVVVRLNCKLLTFFIS